MLFTLSHALPHALQFVTVFVALHVELPASEPCGVQTPFWQDVPLRHAYAAPQPPQLLLSLRKSTHALAQYFSPVGHENVQTPPTQAGTALATVVVQTFPHVLQLLGLVAVFTQVPLQEVGVPGGQIDVQAYPPPALAQRGADGGQLLVQLPHWLGCVMSDSQPSSALLVQWAHPAAQADAANEH